MIDSGSPADKLDIVFVSDKYPDAAAFAGDVQSVTNSLLALEPFSSRRGKINVYYVNKMGDLQCRFGTGGMERLLTCSDFLVKQAAKECPFEKIIVLVNSGQYGGSANTIGGDTAVASKNAQELVAIHELGHLLGLLDEYLYTAQGVGTMEGPNCDTESSGNQQAPCPKWAGIQQVGCYQGCSYRNMNRPTFSSCLMENLDAKKFDPVDIAHMASYLDGNYRMADTGLGGSYTKNDDIYMARIKYKDGRFSVAGIIRDKGYLPQVSEANGELVLLSGDKTPLYSSGINIPSYMIAETFDSGGKISGEIREVTEGEFALIVPLIPGAEKAELYLEGMKTLSTDLKAYEKPIRMEKGWNLISSPGAVQISGILSCGIRGDRAYLYSEGGYVSTDMIEPLKGYWVFSEQGCSVSVFESETDPDVLLHAGWNMISSSNSWSGIKGDCEKTAGLWAWDPITGDYEKVKDWDDMDPTRGYWVKVKKACSIKSGF